MVTGMADVQLVNGKLIAMACGTGCSHGLVGTAEGAAGDRGHFSSDFGPHTPFGYVWPVPVVARDGYLYVGGAPGVSDSLQRSRGLEGGPEHR